MGGKKRIQVLRDGLDFVTKGLPQECIESCSAGLSRIGNSLKIVFLAMQDLRIRDLKLEHEIT